jgi:hypothetical protein
MVVARWKPSFFQLPYSSWYALHNDVAVAALILVTILGLTGTINGEVISGLFASVVGYVLGSVGSKVTSDAAASRTAFAITTSSPLPPATIGRPYACALKTTGGSGPYTWEIAAGTLPAGLTLDGAKGVIRGNPQGPAQETTIAVQVSDTSHDIAAKVLSLRVQEA